MKRRGFLKVLTAAVILAGCKPAPKIPDGCQIKTPSCKTGVAQPRQPFMILYPPNYSGEPAPLCIYHGGVGEACNAPRVDTLKTSLINDILSAGYVVASSSAHGDNWGNSAALKDYIELYRHISACHKVTRTVLLSQSMGGCSGLLTAANRPFEIKGWAGIYPVCNLRSMYDATKFHDGISAAYDISKDGSNYDKKTIGHDPVLIPDEKFSGLRMRFYASPEDKLVSKTANTDLMARGAQITAIEAGVVQCVGDHGDPSHFQSDDLISFFSRCT